MTDASPTAPILSVAHLSKRFHHAAGIVHAVDDVSFDLAAGEFVAVMGASGSGKSTLLHLIAGLTGPDSGRLAVAGQDMLRLGDYERTVFRRNRIGLIFQAFNLIPDLTGRENILLPSLLGRTPVAAGEPDGLIEKLGIATVCARRPDAMSGGEQQRVAIARSLVARPDLLLADEPTGALDTANSQRLCELLKGLCAERGTTVLMVTHNPVVAFWAERILVMRDGRMVEDLQRARFDDLGAFSQHYADLLAGKAVHERHPPSRGGAGAAPCLAQPADRRRHRHRHHRGRFQRAGGAGVPTAGLRGDAPVRPLRCRRLAQGFRRQPARRRPDRQAARGSRSIRPGRGGEDPHPRPQARPGARL